MCLQWSGGIQSVYLSLTCGYILVASHMCIWLWTDNELVDIPDLLDTNCILQTGGVKLEARSEAFIVRENIHWISPLKYVGYAVL